jgi:hypothetical protein
MQSNDTSYYAPIAPTKTVTRDELWTEFKKCIDAGNWTKFKTRAGFEKYLFNMGKTRSLGHQLVFYFNTGQGVLACHLPITPYMI